MEIPFVSNIKKNGEFIYRINPLFRIFSGLICALIASTSVMYGLINPVGIFLALAASAGCAYTEYWEFCSNTEIIEYRSGFFPIIKKTQWNASETNQVRLSVFMKGSIDQKATSKILERMDTGITKPFLLPFAPERSIRITLLIEFKNGASSVIDETGFRSYAKLVLLGRKISEIIHVPFVT